jgi:HlyD family secretion protein
MKISLGKLLLAAFGLALVAGVVYGFLPKPIDVDFGRVTVGPLLVSVDEDGKTRIREKYIVSMPFPGRIERITLDPGDSVAGGESVLATVFPIAPDLLNERSLAEAEARVSAAEASVKRSASALEKSRSEQEWAEATANRIRKLYEQKATTEERLLDANLLTRSRLNDVQTAEFARDIANYELEQAKAGLIRAQPRTGVSAADAHYDVLSPISGKVLRVFQESAATLQAGAQLIEIGDPKDLEMEIDVLSQDAVQIKPGAAVYVDHWGGDKPLVGSVRLVEPSGFTKISALGVEEQRVNVIAAITVPAEERTTLGDAFRVDAKIAVWEGKDVLQVPASALFRDGTDWAVFVVDSGDRARRRTVEIGHRNSLAAEIVSGLTQNDQVVLHPGDTMSDGVAVRPRPSR